MAHVILFHSVLGFRPSVAALARRLTAAGHPTLAPDLFDGRSSDNVDEGFAILREIGLDTVMQRARLAVRDAAEEAVLVGISMGSGIAGDLWGERPRAAGVVFISGPGPIPEPRPSGAPIQMHMARPDPFDTEDFVAEWSTSPLALPLSVYRYDGVGHNFLDEGGPDFDADAAALCEKRLMNLLAVL